MRGFLVKYVFKKLLMLSLFVFAFFAQKAYPNKYLAIGSVDGIHIYDTKDWTFLGVLMWHEGDVTSLSFSKNGKYLAAGFSNGMVEVWDTSGSHCREWVSVRTFGQPAENLGFVGREQKKEYYKRKPLSGISSISFGKDDTFLCYIDRNTSEVRILDTSNSDPGRWTDVGTLNVVFGSPMLLSFSSDGRYLAINQNKGIDLCCVDIWDVRSSRPTDWKVTVTIPVPELRGSLDIKALKFNENYGFVLLAESFLFRSKTNACKQKIAFQGFETFYKLYKVENVAFGEIALAGGNYDGYIEVEKSKYFKRFRISGSVFSLAFYPEIKDEKESEAERLEMITEQEFTPSTAYEPSEKMELKKPGKKIKMLRGKEIKIPSFFGS